MGLWGCCRWTWRPLLTFRHGRPRPLSCLAAQVFSGPWGCLPIFSILVPDAPPPIGVAWLSGSCASRWAWGGSPDSRIWRTLRGFYAGPRNRRASAFIAGRSLVPAGHGVHRRIFNRLPVVQRPGPAVNLCRQAAISGPDQNKNFLLAIKNKQRTFNSGTALIATVAVTGLRRGYSHVATEFARHR